MTPNISSALFTPMALGSLPLEHRIVGAPLTRFRATSSHAPHSFVKEYYVQRASTPGTLLMSESNLVSPRAGLLPHMSGIWSEEQISAWKDIVTEVHRKGCYMICHITGAGRAADAEEMAKYGQDVIGPSTIPISARHVTPREMSETDVRNIISDYATAARNAIEKVGFDGVEIHACNGYLLDQFTQDVSNQRSDSWGGSIEKRSRLVIEVVKAVIKAVGSKVPVGIRLSPWGTYCGMRMEDPIPQFTYLLSELKNLDISHLHLIEPRVSADVDVETVDSNIPFLEAWGNEKPVVVAGGYTTTDAACAIMERYRQWTVAVAFGRLFISNPDLVYRVDNAIELAAYNRATFYQGGESGYTDYPFSREFMESKVGQHGE